MLINGRMWISAGLNGFTRGVLLVLLRGLTLISKLILLIYLARHFDPSDIGVYGLFTVTIAFALFIVGLDFYHYSTRELLSRKREQWAPLLRDQAIFYALVYLIVLPLGLLVFAAGLLEWRFVGWLYLILGLEHLSQEAYRLLVAISRPGLANVILFIRSGSWVYAVVALMWIAPSTQHLSTVWIGWAGGVTGSLLLARHELKSLDWGKARSQSVDWTWIRRGVKVAVPFLIGTLALRGIFTVDRYFLKAYWGDAAVGVYTVYVSIANALQSFVEAGVVSHFYPRIVRAYSGGRIIQYRTEVTQMTVIMVCVLAVMLPIAAIAIEPLLSFIGHASYLESKTVFWILLGGVFIFSIGMVPHYILYARQDDLKILLVSLSACLIMIGTGLVLVPSYGSLGAAIALFVSVSSVTIGKFFMALNTKAAPRKLLTFADRK